MLQDFYTNELLAAGLGDEELLLRLVALQLVHFALRSNLLASLGGRLTLKVSSFRALTNTTIKHLQYF